VKGDRTELFFIAIRELPKDVAGLLEVPLVVVQSFQKIDRLHQKCILRPAVQIMVAERTAIRDLRHEAVGAAALHILLECLFEAAFFVNDAR
jgi:hypothetical protein